MRISLSLPGLSKEARLSLTDTGCAVHSRSFLEIDVMLNDPAGRTAVVRAAERTGRTDCIGGQFVSERASCS